MKNLTQYCLSIFIISIFHHFLGPLDISKTFLTVEANTTKSSDGSQKFQLNVGNFPSLHSEFDVINEEIKNGIYNVRNISENLASNTIKTLESIPRISKDTDKTQSGMLESINDSLKASTRKTVSCPKETTYNITNPNQLKNYMDEFECLYARGIAPKTPPIGLWYGGVLSLINTNILNSYIETIWAGKLAVQTKCKNSENIIYMIFNFVGKEVAFPAHMYVGTLQDTVAEGEVDDKRPHLFVDYSTNLNAICPPDNNSNYSINFGVISDIYPVNQMIDLLRVVGKTSDGGYIMLGKTILRDIQGFPDHGDKVIAWWWVISYDSDAFPERSSWELNELENSFEYSLPSALSSIDQLLSLSHIVKDPIGSILKWFDLTVRQPFGMHPLSEIVKTSQQLAGKPNHMDVSFTNSCPGCPKIFLGRMIPTTNNQKQETN